MVSRWCGGEGGARRYGYVGDVLCHAVSCLLLELKTYKSARIGAIDTKEFNGRLGVLRSGSSVSSEGSSGDSCPAGGGQRRSEDSCGRHRRVASPSDERMTELKSRGGESGRRWDLEAVVWSSLSSEVLSSDSRGYTASGLAPRQETGDPEPFLIVMLLRAFLSTSNQSEVQWTS